MRRDPRKVKSSFSLRAPCVTSSRIDNDDDDGAPVAWQRLARPRRKKRTRESRSTLTLSLSFSSPERSSPLFSQPSPHPSSLRCLYSLAPLDSSPSGGRHLNWTVAIAEVSRSLLRGSERGRESEKASSFRVPFCFGAASFKSSSSSRQLQPRELVGIVCKRSQPFEFNPNFIVEFMWVLNKNRETQ